MRAVSARLAQLLWFWAVLRTTRVAGALVNRTIDDQLGDTSTGFIPSYSPVDGWARGDQCTGCNIHPGIVDLSQTYDRTWHDSTYHAGNPDHTITFGFNGTAVYVYHLLAGAFSGPSGTTTFTNLTFFLDGRYVGQFIHAPDNTSGIQYNVLVFNQTNLSHQPHSFKTVTNGPTDALILFDYAIYTTEDDPAPSSTSSQRTSSTSTTSTSLSAAQPSSHTTSSMPVGAIVGGTVGGVAVLAAVGVLFFCMRRRHAVRPPSIAERVEPFTIDGDERVLEDSTSRRISRPPRLPDLRLGRTRLMPGAGSSTTGSSSAGSTRHLFTPHRPRLPPLPPQPPQSVSGRTDRSRSNTELAQRIQTLEAQMRALETRQQSGSSGSSPRSGSSRGTRSNPSSNSSGSRGRSTNRSAPSLGLRNELANLRNEIAELRGELEHDQQLLAEVDAHPPSYNP